MEAILTTNFSADIESINTFYGWPNNHVTTWQTEPILHEGNSYIVYSQRIAEWALLNNKIIGEINLNENT